MFESPSVFGAEHSVMASPRASQSMNHDVSSVTDPDQAVTSGNFTQLTEEDNTDQPLKLSKVAVLRLLDLYQADSYFAKFQDKTTKNKVIWNEIASELRKERIEVTGEQCNTKF